MYSLYLMEESGGEVDVVGFDEVSNKYIFMDYCKRITKWKKKFIVR